MNPALWNQILARRTGGQRPGMGQQPNAAARMSLPGARPTMAQAPQMARPAMLGAPQAMPAMQPRPALGAMQTPPPAAPQRAPMRTAPRSPGGMGGGAMAPQMTGMMMSDEQTKSSELDSLRRRYSALGGGRG